MEHYSYSRLSLYGQCPLRYKRRYIEKREEPPSRALNVGSGVHAAIAAYDEHLVAEGLQTDVTYAPLALAAAWEKMAKEGRRLSEDEKDEVEEVFLTFVDSHILEPESVVSIEEMEEVERDGYVFCGVLDLLSLRDGIPVVRDYKTDHQVRSPAAVAHDPQLATYAVLVHWAHGYEEVLCELDFVRHRTIRQARFDLPAIKKAEARLLSQIEALEAERAWAPTPGSHCAWCPWSDHCTAVSDQPLRLATAEDAERLASEILVLERQIKDRQALLKEWCAVEGPVEVGGEVFGHLPTKDGGWKVTDKPTFAEVLDSHGLDPWEYFAVNSTKLRSLRTAKKWAHVLADIEPLLEREVKTTFCHRRAGEKEDQQ